MNYRFKEGLVMWGLMAFFSFFQFFMQMSGNLMEVSWKLAFHATPAGVSWISSAFFYGYVLVQIPAGFLFDTLGMKKVVRYALFLFVLGLLGLALSPSFYFALLARFLMGLGAGFAFVGMVYAASSWFKANTFVIFIGLGELFSMLLTAVGQAVSPGLILHFGWRAVMIFFAGIGFVLFVLILRFFKNPPDFQFVHARIFPAFLKAWKEVSVLPAVWLAGLFCCGMFSVITVFASLWGNQYLQARYSLSYLSSSHLIALIPLGLALGSPVMGFLNERVFAVRNLMVAVSLLLGVSALLMMFMGQSPFVLGASLFFLGVFGSSNVLAFYIAGESVPSQIRGISIGLCNTLVIFVGMIFQPLMGFLIEHGTIFSAMYLFPGIIFFSFLISLILRLKWRKM